MNKRAKHLINAIYAEIRDDEDDPRLNNWEQNFIKDIKLFINRGRRECSERQLACLESINKKLIDYTYKKNSLR